MKSVKPRTAGRFASIAARRAGPRAACPQTAQRGEAPGALALFRPKIGRKGGLFCKDATEMMNLTKKFRGFSAKSRTHMSAVERQS